MPAPANSVMPSIFPPQKLLTASCPSSSTCFAVGDIERESYDVPLVERWNGRGWSIQRTPRAPGGQPGHVWLSDVSCALPTACTAVGYSGPAPLIERWNGRTWSIQKTLKPVRGGFEEVSCPSSRTCVALGHLSDRDGTHLGALAERWNGSRWLREQIPSKGYFGSCCGGSGPGSSAGGYFTGLSCVSASACLAVGNWASLCALTRPSMGTCSDGQLVWRWDGSHWSMRATRSFARYGALSCATATWCIVAGQNARGGLALRRWNGLRLVTQPPQSSRASEIGDVSCVSTTACIAVGDGQEGDYGPPTPLVWRWDGRSWIDQSPSNPNATPMLR
jgi:hypothetical protein